VFDVSELQAWLAVIGSIAGGAYVLWKWIRPRVKGRIARSVAAQKVRQLFDDVDAIKAQLQPNGGESLRDRVEHIAERVDRHEAYNELIINGFERPVINWDPNGQCVKINRAYRELTGFDQDDLRGMNWVNVIHPEDRDDVMNEWRHTLRDQREFSMQFRHRRRGDREIVVLLEARPIIAKTGGVVRGWFGTVTEGEVPA
jgi:PAS domain S-box-containing protein